MDEYLCSWCISRIDPCMDIHWSCSDSRRAIPIYSAVHYSGLPREVVLRLKFSGMKYMSRLGARIIMEYSAALPGRNDLLIPIPAGGRTRRERGYNQAELLSNQLAGMTGAASRNILKRKNSPSQVGLSVDERRKNVAGVFSVKKYHDVPDDRHLWIIDDVATTCSTMESASEALLRAGAGTVSGLTLAYRKLGAGSIV